MKKSLLLFLLLFAAVSGYGQCTLSVNLTSSNPAICSGTSVTLAANASAGTAPYTYAWSTGETTSTISVNKAGTYTVTVTDKTPGCAPVKQSITITSGTVPNAPTAANVAVCPNNPATLTATAPGGTYQWYDAATGGNFLVSGATYTTPPITTSPTIFYVQTTINGCPSSRTAVTVTLPTIPPTANATVCSGNTATLLASGGGTYAWYASASGGTVLSTSATFITPVLTATTVYYVVVTSPSGCVSAPVAVTASVTPPPQPPVVAGTTICSGSVVTLHATVPAGIVDWFTVPTGGTSLISSPDFTTPPLTATTTYYVQTTLNTCESARTPVTVAVNPIPADPVVPGVTTCAGSTATLTPSGPGGTYNWYSAASGGVLLATGNSYTTPALTSTTTYYVLTSNGGCTSGVTPVTVTVTPLPASPSASGAIICSGTSTTLTATAPGGVYQWYDAATGGNLLATNASFTTPVLTTSTTYYVQTTVGSCTSLRTPVPVTILPPPAAPVAPGVNVCSGNSATLSVTSPSGTYAWYDAATGGNLLVTAPAYVTPALTANTTYYVEFISTSGCASARTPVTVTVTAPPGAPVVNPVTVCPGTVATLTATATGTVTWYDAATGGNLLATGSTYITPALSSATTYYAEQTTATCTSPRTAVTVSITSVASPQFQYSSGTFCKTGTNPTPTINNPSGGTFSASPAGLVFVSTTTGQINLTASAAGEYLIKFAGNGACPTTTSADVTISLTPAANFSYSTPVCQDAGAVFPVFPAGSSAGVFSGSSGVVFLNTSTGEIDLVKTTPGVHTITNTIAASGSCPASTFSFSITLDQSVVVSAGPNQTVPAGSPVTLSGTIIGGATTGTWSGGTGTFANPNSTSTTYTPGPGETSATLTLTSAHPTGSCGPKSSTVTITFSSPSAPTVSGATICSGNVVTLSPTGPGGTYAWYDAPTGGTLLYTGNAFTTPALTANATYYVQTTVGGATSPRTAVTVTVSPTPAPPVATGGTACSGSTTTLTATGSAGTYQWYDAATGGNLLSTNNTYTTTVLSANASYYVESVVNGCVSTRTQVNVIVNPVPAITSASSGSTCSGVALAYNITSGTTGATFTWSRAAVANISNPAVTNQTTPTITETLINTGTTAVNVTYVITPTANGCSGTPFNYVVTVNPSPTVTSPAAVNVCNETAINYNITFSSPGVTFTWSRAAVTGVSNAPITGQAATTIRESLFNTTSSPIVVTYVISFQGGGCNGLTFNLVVTVSPSVTITSAAKGTACSGVAQSYAITSDATGATYSWSRAAVPNISNPAVTGQSSATINEALVNTGTTPVSVIYMITPIANGCAGAVFKYTTVVNPAVPTPVANANSPVCTSSTISLQSPIVPNATYNWSGPNGFTSAQQNPNITNVTTANSGTYNLFITINGCNSTTVSVNVTVDPPPVAVAGPPQTVCTTVTSVSIAGSVTGGTTTGLWSTAGTGTFSQAPNILTNTYIPSAADIAAGSVVLTLASTSLDNCTVSMSNLTITFKAPSITSAAKGSVCTGTAQNYAITSDEPTATFTWSRAAVTGISNPAVSKQTSPTITENLNNTGTTAIDVIYLITPINGTCQGAPFTYTVTVNPMPLTPAASSNSPVCTNSTITLTTTAVPGATYVWTGPNGFTSAAQNPTISNASAGDAGQYIVHILVNGCQSPDAVVNVAIDALPVSVAGPNQVVCPAATSVQLAGAETGGTPTGQWSTSGTGTFANDKVLNTQYSPSAADIAAGEVTLTLSSTSSDNCAISTSTMTVKFQLLSAVTAGPDQTICSQDVAKLAGKITIPGGGIWSTSGTGTFNPAPYQLNASYMPSAADIAAGSVVLTLTANSADNCYIPTDKLTVKFIPPPTVNAGGTKYVLKGQTITLTPTVSDPDVTYSWSPDIDISSTSVEDPTITGNVDQTYTLTVTDSRGCTSSDKVNIIVSPNIVIPNAFTPNGDGVNDQWNIQGLTAYQQATVDIFDRNGQKIFHSVGYGIAWDGTYNGKQVPYGVYYYIIDPKFSGLHVLSGSVTVIR